ncbi:hypothetical protein GCM10023172_30870 [Hymenobacter ginsengisoli]|uniref:DUF4168 domain-containing protein n=1 Tax=Hymenobacter ginsengisoli TaxID=1051626 RepID=A0ABP8QJM2_9BACT|nr:MULTISPECIES: hypothetical protein [unclassified Hymenobacter]MBO2033300.1 hypothetical protein [Hymenobacter sp. BT559]
MKKLVLSTALLLGLGAAQTAQAQAALLLGRLVGIGVSSAIGASRSAKLTPEQKAAQQQAAAQNLANQAAAERNAAGWAAPTELVMHRTPAAQLPKQAAEQITTLEAQLDACHAAMLASPTGPVCPPEQRAAIQQAAMGVARAKPGFDLHPYQQEMAYYMAEDARRQQAAAPSAPAK